MSVELLDSPIAFHRAFVGIGAGITGALMLSQAVYWTKRTKDADGWFYKTQTDWEDETGLSRYEQEGARAKLKKLGVLIEEKRGVPCKTYYRVDVDTLNGLLNQPETPKTSSLRKTSKLECGNPATKNAEIPQSSEGEPPEPVCGNSTDKAAENPRTITEITTETTKDYEQTDCADLAEASSSPADESPSNESGSIEGELVNQDSYTGVHAEVVPGWTFAQLIDPPSADDDTVFIALPLRSDQSPPVHLVRDLDVLNLKALYPSLDVPGELRSMLGWCYSHPNERKLHAGIKKFITGWLNRSKAKGSNPWANSLSHLTEYEKVGAPDRKTQKERVRSALRDIQNTQW